MQKHITTSLKKTSEGVVKATTEVFEGADKIVSVTEKELSKVTEPIRSGLFKRFPTLTLLLATIGVTATLTGIEQFLLQYGVLQRHPGGVFLVGVAILALTGTLYKRLG